ncbi:hypothetical protein L6452_09123 [Arctium lappa]|uniref:Uncharacterized protein n=1 Tax=Arctium lappa TaxID=4217 RepID=A0ACB9DJ49_ARCLA|nr:hypothetical protein L6452_09123 [Arctium lappa]
MRFDKSRIRTYLCAKSAGIRTPLHAKSKNSQGNVCEKSVKIIKMSSKDEIAKLKAKIVSLEEKIIQKRDNYYQTLPGKENQIEYYEKERSKQIADVNKHSEWLHLHIDDLKMAIRSGKYSEFFNEYKVKVKDLKMKIMDVLKGDKWLEVEKLEKQNFELMEKISEMETDNIKSNEEKSKIVKLKEKGLELRKKVSELEQKIAKDRDEFEKENKGFAQKFSEFSRKTFEENKVVDLKCTKLSQQVTDFEKVTIMERDKFAKEKKKTPDSILQTPRDDSTDSECLIKPVSSSHHKTVSTKRLAQKKLNCSYCGSNDFVSKNYANYWFSSQEVTFRIGLLTQSELCVSHESREATLRLLLLRNLLLTQIQFASSTTHAKLSLHLLVSRKVLFARPSANAKFCLRITWLTQTSFASLIVHEKFQFALRAYHANLKFTPARLRLRTLSETWILPNRFLNFIERQVNGDNMMKSLTKVPFVKPNKETPPTNEEASRLKADRELRANLMLALPNSVYNRVDHCKDYPNLLWAQLEKIMLGSSVATQLRHRRFMNNFEEFKAKDSESIKSVFDRFCVVINDLKKIKVEKTRLETNLKFLNAL